MPSSKRVTILSCTLWVLSLISVLNVLPLILSLGIETSVAYYASDAEIIIEKNVYGSIWNASKTIEVDFIIKDLPQSVNVIVLFERELLANFSQWQVTRIKYMFILNGETSRVITEDLVGIYFNTIGGYENKPLNNSLVKVGANKFTLKINITSTCENICYGSFKMIIRDLRVQVHVIDLDKDGIWDNIDQLPINNNVFTVFLSAITTPIVGYLSLTFRKIWEKKRL